MMEKDLIFIEITALGWLCAAIALVLCAAITQILLLMRRISQLEKLLIEALKQRIDNLEVEQHRHPDPRIDMDLHFCRGVLFHLLAPQQRSAVRTSVALKLKAIANPRLHWRIWRRPLAAPDPTEIATHI